MSTTLETYCTVLKMMQITPTLKQIEIFPITSEFVTQVVGNNEIFNFIKFHERFAVQTANFHEK